MRACARRHGRVLEEHGGDATRDRHCLRPVDATMVAAAAAWSAKSRRTAPHESAILNRRLREGMYLFMQASRTQWSERIFWLQDGGRARWGGVCGARRTTLTPLTPCQPAVAFRARVARSTTDVNARRSSESSGC